MPSLPVYLLFILTSSALFHLAPSIPLSNHRRFLPQKSHLQSTPPPQYSKPNRVENSVQKERELFSKLKPTNHSSNEANRANKFGLWATGATIPEKTIFLNDGVAKNDATFTLLLREGEQLKGMRHRPDDTSIITSFEETRQRHVTNLVSYNITITHHFTGTVGVAQYELTVFTTKGAALRVMGVYYVAGIVLYASTNSKPPRIVSGLASPPLTVDSISSFSSFTGISTPHRVLFPLKFQHVGPDINPTPLSIVDQLSKALVSVTSTTSGGEPILSNNSACQIMRKRFYSTQANDSHDDNCDVRLDLDSMSLEMNLNPEGYGEAVIDISLPGTSAKARMKTEVRLNVLKPAIIRPKLDLKRDIYLGLDHFGSESFSLPMKNMNTDTQQRKVLSYVIDLPENRYAISDFTSSSMDGPTQFASFSVIPLGLEDKKLQEAIKHALKLLPESKRKRQREKISYVDVRQLQHSENKSSPFQDDFLVPFMPLIREQTSKDFRFISVDLAGEMNDSYQSHVHALFPRINTPITAENPSRFNIWTSFSSKELAQVEPLRAVRGRRNMLFKLILLRYTLSTFSRHKSMQISSSLSKQVSKICKTGVEQANLVKIDDKGLNLEATFHVVAPMKFTDSDIKINQYKKNMSRSVSSDVLLKSGQLQVKEIVRLVTLWKPTPEESTTAEATNRLKGIKGILLGIFVGLSVVILVPILILYVGPLLASRRRADDSPGLDHDQDEEEPRNDGIGRKSMEVPQPASDVLKDNYGRAEESSYPSFTVSSEMVRQGYFGGKALSTTQKRITFADT